MPEDEDEGATAQDEEETGTDSCGGQQGRRGRGPAAQGERREGAPRDEEDEDESDEEDEDEETKPAKKSQMGLLVIVLAVLLVAVAGVAAADYFNVLSLGLFSKPAPATKGLKGTCRLRHQRKRRRPRHHRARRREKDAARGPEEKAQAEEKKAPAEKTEEKNTPEEKQTSASNGATSEQPMHMASSKTRPSPLGLLGKAEQGAGAASAANRPRAAGRVKVDSVPRTPRRNGVAARRDGDVGETDRRRFTLGQAGAAHREGIPRSALSRHGLPRGTERESAEPYR